MRGVEIMVYREPKGGEGGAPGLKKRLQRTDTVVPRSRPARMAMMLETSTCGWVAAPPVEQEKGDE